MQHIPWILTFVFPFSRTRFGWGKPGWMLWRGGSARPSQIPSHQHRTNFTSPGGTQNAFSNPKIREAFFIFPRKTDYNGEKLATESCCFLGQTLYPHKNTKSQHFALLPGVSASHRALSILIPGGKSYFLGEDSGFLALNTLVAILDWGIWSWEQAGGLGGHRSQTLSQMCPSTPARDIPAFDLLVPRKTPEAAVKFQYGMGP